MSVDNHRHCQATVLGATGVPPENGNTWSDIRDLELTNLEEGWIRYFRDNQNVTEDLAGILKLINWVAGQIPEVIVQPVTEERRVISEDHDDDIILSGTHDGEILDYQEEFGLTQDVFNKLHPVGSIYLSLDTSQPFRNLDGISSTWERIAGGKCLWGADDYHTPNTEITAGLPDITGDFSTVDWGSVESPSGSLDRKIRKSTLIGGFADKTFITADGEQYVPFEYAHAGQTLKDFYIPSNFYTEEYPSEENNAIDNQNGIHDYLVDFKASRMRNNQDEQIYGKSQTVQPPAFVVSVWKRTA